MTRSGHAVTDPVITNLPNAVVLDITDIMPTVYIGYTSISDKPLSIDSLFVLGNADNNVLLTIMP